MLFTAELSLQAKGMMLADVGRLTLAGGDGVITVPWVGVLDYM